MLVTVLVCVVVIAEIVYRFYLIYIFSASPVVFFSPLSSIYRFWFPPAPPPFDSFKNVLFVAHSYNRHMAWLTLKDFETYWDKFNQIYMQLHTDWSVTCKESLHKGTNNNYISDKIDEHHEKKNITCMIDRLQTYLIFWYNGKIWLFFFYQFQFLIILNNDTDILLHTKE